MSEQIKVDHIGFRTISETDYEQVVAALSKVGLNGIESQAPGHRRTFFDIGDGTRLEVQLWDADMPERRQPGVHIDVQSPDPMATLRKVNSNAEDWGQDEVPRGGAFVSPTLTIMARPIVNK